MAINVCINVGHLTNEKGSCCVTADFVPILLAESSDFSSSVFFLSYKKPQLCIVIISLHC